MERRGIRVRSGHYHTSHRPKKGTRTHEYAQRRRKSDVYQPSVTPTLVIHVPVLVPSAWRSDILHRLVTIVVFSAAILLAHFFLLLPSPPFRRRGTTAVLITATIGIVGDGLFALAARGCHLVALAWHVEWNSAAGDGSSTPSTSSLRKSSISVVSIACSLDDDGRIEYRRARS
jgi:hypothetical protein